MTEPLSEQLAVPAPPPLVEPWASWGRRVLASFLDFGVLLPFLVVLVMLGSVAQDPTSGPITQLICGLLSLLTSIASMVFSIWNSIVRQGRTGASLGKQACGILVLSLVDARPIGVGGSFARYLLHILDSASLGLGYLWPLWDERHQTFADKVANTGVLYLPNVRF